MPGEDEAERLLRRFREYQNDLVAKVSRGGCPSTNTPDGYMAVVGRICAVDDCIEIAREIFAHWLPQVPPKPTGSRNTGDY